MPRSDVEALRQLARGQDGVVTRAQVEALGMGRDEIRYKVRTRWLEPVWRGVYALGPLSARGHIRAATLATGPHSAASFSTATALYRLIPTLPAVLHVSLTQGDRRNRPGLIVHHGLESAEVTHVHGIPVTTPLRTLADMGWPDRLVREALARRLVRPEDLPGAAPAPTRSDLERRLLALTRAGGLPEPLVNHAVGPYVLDMVWPALRLVVETDGWATHGPRPAFEADRARDAHLAAMGYVVLRFTWRQVTKEPLLVVSRIAQAAAARSPSASKSSV